MKLTRRAFVATATATLALPAIGRAQDKTLKLSHYLPPQHQINTELMRWADEVKEKSGGSVVIEVFPAGQMGPPPRQYDLARTGVSDISFVFTALNPGRFPLVDALSLPFLFANDNGEPITTAQASRIATSLRDKTAAEFQGTELLYAVVTTSGGWFMRDKLVEKPEDLKGLRIRPTSAAAAAQIKALGASPATIPPTELADAIAKGVVDGAIFNFEGGKAFQLQQSVTKVSTCANSVGYFCLVINSDTLAGLPEEGRKAIMETTGPDAAYRVGGLYDAAEVSGRKFMEEQGVEVIDIRGEQADSFRTALQPVADEQIAALKADGKDVDGLIAAIKAKIGEL
jgi:TRAP-type C4-dicarboxylate transport system substrate-binding protein